MYPVIPVFQKYRRPCVVLIVSLMFIGSAMQQAIAKQTLFEAFKQIIVIDPGHGGQEFGARGPDGTLEKTVTLELARLLADDLGREFKVVLTRTDDYLVDLVNRTSLANHLNADVFISIHTSASFAHSTAGITLFFYQNFSKSDPGQNQGPSSVDQKHNKPILWKNIQSRYLKKSQSLARAIDSRLKNINSNQSRIEGCPLAVLQGAAMPAVLIEVGYLTNPAEEKKLRDDRFMMDLAEQIRKGIEDFFSQEQP
jgi:N-acetylmuramoyl-L-alanine amidase